MNANQYKKFEQYQRHIRNLKRLFPKLRRYDDAEAWIWYHRTGVLTDHI